MERREKRFASRILAWFLTFLMITTMIPTSAFAALPAQEAGAVVSEDASSDETTQDGILLKTTLTDKLKQDSSTVSQVLSVTKTVRCTIRTTVHALWRLHPVRHI